MRETFLRWLVLVIGPLLLAGCQLADATGTSSGTLGDAVRSFLLDFGRQLLAAWAL